MPPATPTAPPSDTTYCRFRAGRSSPPIDGVASLGLSGIEIDLGSEQPKQLWRYEGLKSQEPIRPNAIDVLLSYRDEPGASLFVQGHDFATRLIEYAPQISFRSARSRRWKIAAIGLAIVALAIGAIYASGWSPLKSIAGTFPETWRQRLGNAARDSMTEGYKQCVDPAGQAALTHLAERLEKAVPAGTTFDVRVYDWSLMNAFAVPGGEIVLTKGLIDKAQTADEVAGVLAHEMGHGIEMHPEIAIIRSVGLAAAVQVMLGGTAGGGLANIGLMLAQLGYSRDAERQADRRAIELLKSSAITPNGLASFFKRVMDMEAEQDTSGSKSDAFAWLHTHPPVKERLALVRHQSDYPATPALDEQSWRDLKSICKLTVIPAKSGDES
jgi:predicted Zn-dependent protease